MQSAGVNWVAVSGIRQCVTGSEVLFICPSKHPVNLSEHKPKSRRSYIVAELQKFKYSSSRKGRGTSSDFT